VAIRSGENFSAKHFSVIAFLKKLVTLVTIPPANILILLMLDGEGPAFIPLEKAGAEIVDPEFAEHSVALVPKVASELIPASLNRLLATQLAFIDRTIFVDEVKTFVELHYYVRDNNLHFNIPTLVYRQPSSEHCSEG
jgi:hypothetical protein